jgi:SAM-dependent methyltransferase
MSEEIYYERNAQSESAIANTMDPRISTPQWLAEEYEAGNDGQYEAARHALETLGVWQTLPAGKAVDVGCGSGRLVEALARKGWQVDASDVSESMVQKVMERCRGLPVSAKVSDARKLTLTPKHYSLVTSFWMIHWLEDARPLLKQMANAVAAGGHLALQWSCGQPRAQGFALRDTIQEVFNRPTWRERVKDAPLAMYQHPLEEVSEFLSDADFEILSTRENIVVSGGESPESLKRALRSAAFAAQTVVLGDDVDDLIDECLQLLVERNALQVANSEIIARLK